ncbi:unnamed protein product [Bursaphelenchus okinawaensis]|uniref:Cdc23 domain-containing protein n=1 Tax=Bursaphelenchus okinawaensis TaxID=465554 RepID=A0A811LF10_9BILA|nr:unnamed protein product [Bursaphelenchus okinawaensis]CAG9124061.1 unnamed protein product [Bursaphelenchus okinawaensis]
MDRTEDFGQPFTNYNVASDLLYLIDQCDQRCLYEASRWANEQLVYMEDTITSQLDFDSTTYNDMSGPKRVSLNLVRKLIQNCEYYRARQFLQKSRRELPVENFLYYFSWYMICQRKKAEREIEEIEKKENQNDELFFELSKEIERLQRKNPEAFDSFMYYLLAQIKYDNQQVKDSKRFAMFAIEMDHRCWPAWDLLSKVCTEADFAELEQKPFYRTWQYILFAAEAALRLQLLTMANDFFTELGDNVH